MGELVWTLLQSDELAEVWRELGRRCPRMPRSGGWDRDALRCDCLVDELCRCIEIAADLLGRQALEVARDVEALLRDGGVDLAGFAAGWHDFAEHEDSDPDDLIGFLAAAGLTEEEYRACGAEGDYDPSFPLGLLVDWLFFRDAPNLHEAYLVRSVYLSAPTTARWHAAMARLYCTHGATAR